MQVAAGAVGAQPASADQMYQLSVRAPGRLTEVDEFEESSSNRARTARSCA